MTRPEPIVVGVRDPSIADIIAVARGGAMVELSPQVGPRLAKARAAIEAAAARGDTIYGLTTGLGAGVDTALAPDDLADFQRRALGARMVGVGQPLPGEEVRALLVARLAGLAKGASGISPAIPAAIAAMLNARVTPVVPSLGSIGAADLAPLAHAFAVLVGDGEAELDGRVLPGSEALAAAGLVPVTLGPKDALALINSNAASVGPAALAVADAATILDASLAALALGLEAFRGNLSPIDPRAVALRPTPCLAETAACLRALLDGGELGRPGAARRVQDPLSFRSATHVLAALADAVERASAAVACELDGAGDNPAIVDADGAILSTAGFDATHLALAFEGLGLALSHAAGASFWRVIKLMSPSSSDLPRFLTARGGSRAGFAAVQKTTAALEADIRRLAQPAMLFAGTVADGVEDVASMAPAVVAKTALALGRMRRLVAVELMVAAQALDLRAPGLVAPGVSAILARVRAVVPRLDEDRPTGSDIEALAQEIGAGRFAAD